jgi:nicotinamide mononucleotide transporter
MFDLLNIKRQFFVVWGYPVSYLEFAGTVTGLWAVYLSARERISSWPIGLINVVLSGILYYQVALYPDMFLQVFFFLTNLWGWWTWTHPTGDLANEQKQLKITSLGWSNGLRLVLACGIGTGLLGYFASRLHDWLPLLFSQPSTFPYIDSFILVASVVATFGLVHKKIETWYLWLLVDVVATGLYFMKNIKFYSLLYGLFCVIALGGAITWTKIYRKQTH